MVTNIYSRLQTLSQNSGYWLSYIVAGTAMLAAALYFQHVLEELPCVMCIQMRLLILLLILFALAGLLSRNYKTANVLANLSVVVVASGMLERSYMLLGTERGFVIADCGFSLGLPAWFAIEDWLPWLARIETSCGYTPVLAFGITMAEALTAVSITLLLFSAGVFAASITHWMIQRK